MIGSRLLRRFVRARIERHDARAKAFAAATVAAQVAGDGAAAGRFHTRMCEAQAKRDGLREFQQNTWGVRALPNGDFEVVR